MTQQLFTGPASPKALAFITELAALCERHGVMLTTSGYDGMQVWDRKPEDREPIHAAGIDDMTEQPPPPAPRFKVGDIVRQYHTAARLTWTDAEICYVHGNGAIDVQDVKTGAAYGWSESMVEKP
ncbi:hypothetical protein [uncultured Ramlibacter sp.]|uniref:hypothetical protein n=1 Tax=uncultured Ramlibacter sp. TaxID=260755 RepID=UPI0026198214|nr:hypothetical protein [uncultured Ramlibacter sp.]